MQEINRNVRLDLFILIYFKLNFLLNLMYVLKSIEFNFCAFFKILELLSYSFFKSLCIDGLLNELLCAEEASFRGIR